mgnify:CR=1 FL=1
MLGFYESMISFQILNEMGKHPQRYDLRTRSGRLNVYALSVVLANKKVKSLRGTFEQACLIGFCVAADWAKKNKSFISQNEEKTLHDLILLNGFVSGKKNSFSKAGECVLPSSIETALLKGFHNGFKLGLRYGIRKKISHHSLKGEKKVDLQLQNC